MSIDFWALKMILNQQNNIKNGFSSQNHTQKKLSLFLILFAKNYIF